MDNNRREISDGWVAITDGFVSAIGSGTPPAAKQVIDANDCLVTPGLVNTHHHLYQNLTRAFPPMTNAPLFGWLQTLYPLWRSLDEESANVSAWVGLAELALSGCTTSTDHLYVHPAGAGDLLSAEIAAARDIGVRFHPTRGSMSLSIKDGGLPPDDVVQDHDVILDESARAVSMHHDRSHGAMVRVALAPCSPFSVTKKLMIDSAELATKLDVRLHTHFAENSEDDAFSLATFGCRPMEYLEEVGWCSDRTWLAHCVMPNHEEIQRLGAARIGVAHCPSSNLILSSGVAPVVDLRKAGVHVGIGVDGSSSADSASMWLEARQAMLLAKLRSGADAGTAGDRGGVQAVHPGFVEQFAGGAQDRRHRVARRRPRIGRCRLGAASSARSGRRAGGRRVGAGASGRAAGHVAMLIEPAGTDCTAASPLLARVRAFGGAELRSGTRCPYFRTAGLPPAMLAHRETSP